MRVIEVLSVQVAPPHESYFFFFVVVSVAGLRAGVWCRYAHCSLPAIRVHVDLPLSPEGQLPDSGGGSAGSSSSP